MLQNKLQRQLNKYPSSSLKSLLFHFYYLGVKVEWENLEIRIIRPNLECTNGYIHVIDQVFALINWGIFNCILYENISIPDTYSHI